ncbi:MAG: double zinc ribbon domain-containing protein [Dehalococcoidia bacterium]|nr:double zinc ribbon domain-containing protein [Dehalococcoidia bacterium]MDW8119505.1 double zinc ribbon domain-containing protein [Chloroflexota bacterium]
MPLAQVWEAVVHLVAPARCVGCGRGGPLLCPLCLEASTPLKEPFCIRCAQPLRSLWQRMCGMCGHLQALDGVRAPYVLEGPIRRAVHAFKYRGIWSLGDVLGEFLLPTAQSMPVLPHVVVPVPLHARRLKERGYNQALLLARVVAQGLGIPLEEGMLVRRRASVPLAQLASARLRREAVRDAFACTRQGLGGVAVLLVDDVCTSGATLDACASVLKGAGAGPVWGLTLAREPL